MLCECIGVKSDTTADPWPSSRVSDGALLHMMGVSFEIEFLSPTCTPAAKWTTRGINPVRYYYYYYYYFFAVKCRRPYDGRTITRFSRIYLSRDRNGTGSPLPPRVRVRCNCPYVRDKRDFIKSPPRRSCSVRFLNCHASTRSGIRTSVARHAVETSRETLPIYVKKLSYNGHRIFSARVFTNITNTMFFFRYSTISRARFGRQSRYNGIDRFRVRKRRSTDFIF